jgi:replicative DNA helicase
VTEHLDTASTDGSPLAPPQNLDAERRVLGSLIVFYSPPLTEKVKATGLKPGDFYYRRHEVVYRAVLALTLTGSHVDPMTVTAFLARQRRDEGSWLDVAGGEGYVEYLACFADANGVVDCARFLAEDGRWRRWLAAMHGAIEAAHVRDEEAFWEAVGRVRCDVLPGESLRVIDGEGEAA